MVALSMTLLVSACTSTPEGEIGKTRSKIGQKPYVINGITYYPLPSAKGYKERGIASWYGHPFHGQPTASTERYNMYSLTAAHTVLPLETNVRVTNLENGRSIVVRVNDRGPFVKNRLIDMSLSGAEALAMLQKGTAPVEVEALEDEPTDHREERDQSENMTKPIEVASPSPAVIAPPSVVVVSPKPKPPATPPVQQRQYYVQAGAFQVQQNAVRLAKQLRSLATTDIQSIIVNRMHYFRVVLGPVASIADADQLVRQLDKQGVSTGRILVE